MKKRHARASVARGNQADQNNTAPICLNSPSDASHKTNHIPAWALSGVARSRTGHRKRAITLPHIGFLDRKGGDDE